MEHPQIIKKAPKVILKSHGTKITQKNISASALIYCSYTDKNKVLDLLKKSKATFSP